MDRLRGKREDQPAAGDAAAAAASSSISPSLDLGEASSRQQHAAEALHDPSSLNFASDSTRLYNPYEGLGMAVERTPSKKPSFRLPKEPEFLFSEEASVKTRSWSENLTYYTGSGYLAGALLGGVTGVYRSAAAPVELAGGGATQRLRLNQLLNTSGKLGRTAGNSLGVLGLMFASFESLGRYLNDGLLPEELPSLAAGATTGALFRSVRGPRQAAAAAAVGTLASTGLLAARRFVDRGL